MSEFEFVPCEKCRANYEAVTKLSRQKTQLLADLEKKLAEVRTRAARYGPKIAEDIFEYAAALNRVMALPFTHPKQP